MIPTNIYSIIYRYLSISIKTSFDFPSKPITFYVFKNIPIPKHTNQWFLLFKSHLEGF